jgi:intracellular sulfur oxidation DsrE/DsrF family protein
LRKLTFLAVLLLLICAPVALHAQAKTHRVVIAVTTPDEADWQMTIGNIRHLLLDLKPDSAQIEVVAYGPGLRFLGKTSSASNPIQDLEKLSVKFVACENSMKRMDMTKADLTSGVETVPSGIGEVVRKQEAGWAYIKAGK